MGRDAVKFTISQGNQKEIIPGSIGDASAFIKFYQECMVKAALNMQLNQQDNKNVSKTA